MEVRGQTLDRHDEEEQNSDEWWDETTRLIRPTLRNWRNISYPETNQ